MQPRRLPTITYKERLEQDCRHYVAVNVRTPGHLFSGLHWRAVWRQSGSGQLCPHGISKRFATGIADLVYHTTPAGGWVAERVEVEVHNTYAPSGRRHLLAVMSTDVVALQYHGRDGHPETPSRSTDADGLHRT